MSFSCAGDSYTKIPFPQINQAIDCFTIASERYEGAYASRRLGEIYSRKETAYFNGEKAVRYFERGVKFGDSIACSWLAEEYICGNKDLGIVSDFKKAEELLLMCLEIREESDVHSLKRLGDIYYLGDEDSGFCEDKLKAIQYYEEAWKLEPAAEIASRLGKLYADYSRYEKAITFLTYAAEHGINWHSGILGVIYNDGLSGKKDHVLAEHYFNAAYKEENLNLFMCADYAELLAQDNKPYTNYKKAYEIAEYGLTKYNDVFFLYIKGMLIITGKLVGVELRDTAAIWLKECLRYDTRKLEVNDLLGDCYLSQKEYRNAERHYLNAYELGDIQSAEKLGRMYEKGGGSITANLSMAEKWYRKVYEAGKHEVAVQIGQMYERASQSELAIEWYARAFEKGMKELGVTIGRLYEKQRKIEEAYEWYKKAATAGSTRARQEVACFGYVKKGFFGNTYVIARQKEVDT